MFREHFQSVLERLKRRWSNDRRMESILREGENPPRPLEPKVRDWFGLSKEDYKWIGKNITPQKQVRICERELTKEALLEGFQKTRHWITAKLAVWLGYNQNFKAAEYERYVKMSNGEWFTLTIDCRMKKINFEPNEGEKWLFFKEIA